MIIKIIKNDKQYEETLKYIEFLMEKNSDPESTDGEKLALLLTLVKDYESKFLISLPDPVEAIKFRMEQQGLKSSDLIPYIGSKSKVSEILSKKRPLTISMIRALEKGLGIPAEVLLKESEVESISSQEKNKLPIKEMTEKGYFDEWIKKGISISSAVSDFIDSLNTSPHYLAFMKKTSYVRSPRTMNKHALLAWSKRIVDKANDLGISVKYKTGTVDLFFMKEIVKLSKYQNGPVLAINFLKEHGIAVVIEQHLQGMYLDGVVILNNKERPVIGLTIRFDRLDNFWFVLMHELAHIALHNDNNEIFFDDLEVQDTNNDVEQKADQLAIEAMIPYEKWKDSPASILPSPACAILLANELDISPAIVAGRMRFERKHYHYLNSLVGKDEVRKLFSEIKWKK